MAEIMEISRYWIKAASLKAWKRISRMISNSWRYRDIELPRYRDRRIPRYEDQDTVIPIPIAS